MKDKSQKDAELATLRQRRIIDLERKARIQDQIVELKSRLAAIVEHSNDAIIGVNLNGVITSWNKGAEIIFGYPSGEMTGHNISLLALSDHHDEIPLLLERIRHGEDIEHYETMRAGKDGKQVYSSLTVSAVKSYAGEIIGASIIARDVTRRKKAEETVHKQAQTLNQIYDAVITTDLDGFITGWNKGAERIYLYTSEEALGRHISFIYPEDEHEFLQQKIIAPLKEKGEHESEVRLRKKTGEEFHALLLLSLLRDENNAVIGMVGSSVDITARKKAEEQIKLAKTEWEQTFDAMPDIVAVIDNNYFIRRANKALAARLGIDRDEIIGERCHTIICNMGDPHSRCPGRIAIDTGKEQMEERFVEKLKGHYLISCTPMSACCCDSIKCFVEVCRDISERKKMEERLKEAAVTDTLTGLLNRRGFFTFAEQQISLAERKERNMALLFLDLNNMKEINDKFGHQEGDQALIDTATLLRRTFRESDIVARIGGDEFTVLLTEPSALDFENIIFEHIRKNLEDHNKRIGRAYRLSLSMGMAYYDPKRPCSVEELLTIADAMMYAEKRRGHRK